MSRPPAPTERGFTLVELMVVVIIVGVLAVLAVVGFHQLVGSAYTTEATQMVQSIRVGQEQFHAENGAYADISTTLCGSATCSAFYPHASVGVTTVADVKAPWGVQCTAGCNAGMDWLQLAVHSPGMVLYGYSTIAGLAGSATSSAGGTTVPASLAGISITGPTATTTPTDWYIITAVGDANADALPCVVMANSFQSDLAVVNEGN